MASIFNFDPLAAATQGILHLKTDNTYGYEPFTIAVNGILVEIFEDIIIPPTPLDDDRVLSGLSKRRKYVDKPKPKKLITVKCIIDGNEYVQTKEYKNVKITAKDIGVDINLNPPNAPKIKIFVHK